MAWTEEEIKSFQQTNNKELAEINATLQPDHKGGCKIGIFLFGQVGDLATAMSVLRYRDNLWPGKQIIWYANWPNCDLLRYAPINEVRPWPWAGNGLPEGTPDFWPLLCNENNRLDLIKAAQYELTADLEDGYFPAPHMMTPQQRHGLDYPNVSRKVFGIAPDRPWHPMLSWSEEEKAHVDRIAIRFPLRRNVMIESFFGSGQSIWDDMFTVRTMEICRDKWGSCNFFFASHKNTEQFKDFEGYYSLSKFTPRQASLMINHCDLFVGVSSGMSVVTSAWGLRPTPKVQVCGSHTCSTVSLSLGECNLITGDGYSKEDVLRQYEHKLREVISRIQ